jgi:hypothetical protein
LHARKVARRIEPDPRCEASGEKQDRLLGQLSAVGWAAAAMTSVIIPARATHSRCCLPTPVQRGDSPGDNAVADADKPGRNRMPVETAFCGMMAENADGALTI